MDRLEIFKAIDDERRYQDQKWGREFDDLNTPNDWVAYIAKYLGNAVTLPWNGDAFRKALTKVAALCVAALERYKYADRHYDTGDVRPSGLRPGLE